MRKTQTYKSLPYNPARAAIRSRSAAPARRQCGSASSSSGAQISSGPSTISILSPAPTRAQPPRDPRHIGAEGGAVAPPAVAQQAQQMMRAQAHSRWKASAAD